MQDKNFDQLLNDYKQSADDWVAAIRAEEAPANSDHSMVGMERWDAAGLPSGASIKDRYRDGQA